MHVLCEATAFTVMGKVVFYNLTLPFLICTTNFLLFLSFQQGTVIRHANGLESRIFVVYRKSVKW